MSTKQQVVGSQPSIGATRAITDNTVTDVERLKMMVEAWKKTIEVHQHFNDIQMRIRNFAVTAVVTIIGAAGLAVSDRTSIVFTVPLINWEIRTLLAVWILFVGVVAASAISYVELGYHNLLKGAVKHAFLIEDEIKQVIPDLWRTFKLTSTISENSPTKVLGLLTIRSTGRINLFYGTIVGLLLLLMLALHLSYLAS
jgi:hypothetical protein